MYHKILNLAFATVGFAALASCSSDDSLSKKGGTQGEGSQFLAVNVKNVSASPSLRDVSDERYENGTEDESKLGVVRFYMFDQNGNPFQLADGPGNSANYAEANFSLDGNRQDSVPGVGPKGGDPKNTIERQGRAVLIVDGANGGVPATVVAIANPKSFKDKDGNDLLPAGTPISRDELKAATLQTYTLNTDGKEFAMSNSVYGNNAEFEVSTAGHVRTSAEDAIGAAMDIYIERIAAKVTAKKSDAAEWTTINDKDAYLVRKDLPYTDKDGKSQTMDVYAVVLGWGLADEQISASVAKNISGNANWTDIYLGFAPWTSADYFRSFWETTPNFPERSNKTNHSWDSYTTKGGFSGAAYTMPNTPNSQYSLNEANRSTAPNSLTKVVVAARLYYKTSTGDFVPAVIGQDLSTGINYATLEDLKNAIIASVSGSTVTNGIVKETTNAGTGEKVYADLGVDDIDFVLNGDANRDYEVKATLVKKEGVTYKKRNGSTYTDYDETTTNGYDEANAVVEKHKAIIYKDGATYYYTAIQHLGMPAAKDADVEDEAWNETIQPYGAFGVVRNHWYQVTINSLAGLGTAVYEPGKDIVPVIPENNKSYLAARINVLQWRLVQQTVDINGQPIIKK